MYVYTMNFWKKKNKKRNLRTLYTPCENSGVDGEDLS